MYCGIRSNSLFIFEPSNGQKRWIQWFYVHQNNSRNLPGNYFFVFQEGHKNLTQYPGFSFTLRNCKIKTAGGEMTKFSLAVWKCYFRTEENCGLVYFPICLAVVKKIKKFPHSQLPRLCRIYFQHASWEKIQTNYISHQYRNSSIQHCNEFQLQI